MPEKRAKADGHNKMSIKVTTSLEKTNKSQKKMGLAIELKNMEGLQDKDLLTVQEALMYHLIVSITHAVTEFYDHVPNIKLPNGDDTMTPRLPDDEEYDRLREEYGLGIADDDSLQQDLNDLSKAFDETPDMEDE